MSRSFRHSPVAGLTTTRSEKLYKAYEHRRLRVALQRALAHGDWDRASYDVREDVWTWGKDGKAKGWAPEPVYQGWWYSGQHQDEVDYWSTWRAWRK